MHHALGFRLRGIALAASALVSADVALGQSACTTPFAGFAPVAQIAGYPNVIATGLHTLGDLNNDGNLDLIVSFSITSPSPSQGVSVHLGAGGGVFGAAQTFTAGANPGRMAVGDFNRDGDLDVAVLNTSSGTVSILLGDGAGGLSAPTAFAVGPDPSDVATADINGDGRLDLVVSNRSGNSVSILLGLGNGSFANQLTRIVGAEPVALSVADLNNDGAPDIAVVNYAGDSMSLIPSNGFVGFGPTVTLSLGGGSQPNSVVAGDFDSDGNADLAVIASGAVQVMLGAGNGFFGVPQAFPAGFGPSDINAADIDLDGDLDLVVMNTMSGGGFTNGAVSVLLGAGDGTFATQQSFAGAIFPWSAIGVGDLDNDGAPDICMTGSFLSVWWLRNGIGALPPDSFSLLSPPDGAAGLPIPDLISPWPAGAAFTPLVWDESCGLNITYTVTIATDPALTAVVLTQPGVVGTEFGIPTGVLLPGTTYYWAVTAMNPNGSVAAAQPVFEFSTGIPADLNGDGVVDGTDLLILLNSWTPP